MTKSGYFISLLLLPCFLAIGCGWGDEAEVRALVTDFVNSAKEGDIEKALALASPDNPSARLLASLKHQDESRYQKSVATLAAELQERFKETTFHIRSAEIEEDSAVIRLTLLGKNEEEELVMTAVKRDGIWLLRDWTQ